MSEKKNEKTGVEKLKKELAAKGAQIQDYTEHLKRLQAEFENYMKRVEKERAELIASASERILVKLLLIVDDFERAMPQLENVSDELKQGIGMIFDNLHKLLDEEHVKAIDATGKFDANKHEVLMKVESSEPEDEILEEMQTGYELNGKVIRYSKVKISGGK